MKKIVLVLLISLVMGMFLISKPAAAAQDGSGESNAFSLISSSVADGEANVPADRQIELKFSKNVVNISVKANNLNCFNLVDEQGNAVPVNVIMADDQIDRDKRNDIIVKPVNKLTEAKRYTLTISDQLMAKSGEILGRKQQITFATVGYQAAANSSKEPLATPGSASTSGNRNLTWPIIGALLVVAAVGLIWLKKRAS